ncbi:unnamed protein product [Mycena citricolor]|uniref:Uncharacterized protein n=1 Tax=Mycena citricolor TaxID=2018698 RepID=A0AAD2K2H7_9AGAR|nr:unnamed protein product [Mycena citricolor]
MEVDETGQLEALRLRVSTLERDLQTANAAKEEVELELDSFRDEVKHIEHAGHAARNLASYGHSDEIIFVRPDDPDQGTIQRLSKGTGTSASVCRLMVRYNIDQFLQRPVLHQWLQNGKLYRQTGEQQSSRFELFFDLLFVGMVHQISEAAAVQPTGLGLLKYILTFAPAYSIWSDMRDIANRFSNDDVVQRAYILWTMLLLVGYSNNASAIEISSAGQSEESRLAMRWTMGFYIIAKASKVLLTLSYSLFLPMSRIPLQFSVVDPLLQVIIILIAISANVSNRGVIAIVAVSIVADHLIRVLAVLLDKTMVVLGKRHDRKRRLQRQRSAQRLYPGSPQEELEKDWTGELDADVSRTRNSSMTAVNEEAPLEDIPACHWVAAKEDVRFPAINIEHLVERLGAFVTIVLGEIVVSVFFASSAAAGINAESGRAFLGLMIAFNLNWMYFTSHASKHFVHAIRRHWLAGYTFSMLHFPMCMSLLLASSAINRMVVTESFTTSEEGGPGLKWFFGAGLGVAVFTMATIGVLHKNLDDQEGLHPHHVRKVLRTTISRRVVLGMRFAASIVMMLVPISSSLKSMQFLAIYVGITGFLIVEETIARIEKRDQALDEEIPARINDPGTSV